MPKSTKLSPDARLWMHVYNGLKLVDECTTLTPEQKQRVTELLRAANDVIDAAGSDDDDSA